MKMTREEILESAVQIFSQKGYHATSMQDIAQAVKLQKASLYHHVHSKQEILVAILDRALDLLIENIQNVALLQLPADVKLHQAVQVYLKLMLENRDLAAVLLLEHRSLDPDLKNHHIPRRDRFEGLWRDLIQDGIDQEIFTCQDSATAARALLGMMNWSITWFRPDGSLTAEQLSDQFADLFLRGLMPRMQSQ